ncbi:MAG TPA: allantoinase PuuE [Acetobacteraceae bacterium]|nr:allantoinase PuuE [Acetobacteraceae bacterium]
MTAYPRDMTGYGRTRPDPRWPGEARICVQFVVNYEEGAENNILHGDAASEAFLSEIPGAVPWPGERHWNMESIYEYGSRAGFWRLWRLFTERGLRPTVFGVVMALDRGREQVAAMQGAGWEIASHGLRWIDYRSVAREVEAAHLAEAIRLHEAVTASAPNGFYLGRCSMNTRALTMEQRCFRYSSDSYADDLPYWVEGPRGRHLIIPYALDANDMRFSTTSGFSTGEDFLGYLRDSFDVLYREGEAGRPAMLNVGLHCRLAGRPGRLASVARFLDHVQAHDKVWIARRIEIAEHWHAEHQDAG